MKTKMTPSPDVDPGHDAEIGGLRAIDHIDRGIRLGFIPESYRPRSAHPHLNVNINITINFNGPDAAKPFDIQHPNREFARELEDLLKKYRLIPAEPDTLAPKPKFPSEYAGPYWTPGLPPGSVIIILPPIDTAKVPLWRALSDRDVTKHQSGKSATELDESFVSRVYEVAKRGVSGTGAVPDTRT